MRLWINNGNAFGNANNNSLFTEVPVPAALDSATVANNHIDIPLNITLPAGYRLAFSLAAVSETFLYVTAIYNDLTA